MVKLTIANQGYLVYLVFGIIIAVTPFIKVVLPLSYGDYNVSTYETVENAPEGSWVVGYRFVSQYSFWKGGLSGANLALHKHMLFDKGLKLFVFNVGVGHGQELLPTYHLGFYKDLFGVPLNEASIYGTQIVYLGWIPIPEENAWEALRDDIFAIKDTDYWGTPLTDLPMFQGEDAIKKATEAYIIYDIYDNAIAMFPDQKRIELMDDSWIAYGSAVYAAGQIEGFIGGMRGGAEYEAMTGYLGGCTLVMVQSFTSASFCLILIIAGSVLYYRKRMGGRA